MTEPIRLEELPIKIVRALPRVAKRRVWLSWWKYQRHLIPGSNRAEQRANHRALWDELTMFQGKPRRVRIIPYIKNRFFRKVPKAQDNVAQA